MKICPHCCQKIVPANVLHTREANLAYIDCWKGTWTTWDLEWAKLKVSGKIQTAEELTDKQLDRFVKALKRKTK